MYYAVTSQNCYILYDLYKLNKISRVLSAQIYNIHYETRIPQRWPLNFQHLLLLRSLFIRNTVYIIFIMQIHYRRFDVTPR